MEVLDVSVAEHETRVDLHGMLDDNRRNAVTMVGELHNPVSLTRTSRPGHAVILRGREGLESAHPRHCRTLRRRSLHDPICRPSLRASPAGGLLSSQPMP